MLGDRSSLPCINARAGLQTSMTILTSSFSSCPLRFATRKSKIKSLLGSIISGTSRPFWKETRTSQCPRFYNCARRPPTGTLTERTGNLERQTQAHQPKCPHHNIPPFNVAQRNPYRWPDGRVHLPIGHCHSQIDHHLQQYGLPEAPVGIKASI